MSEFPKNRKLGGLRRTYSLSVQTGQQPVLFRILFCRRQKKSRDAEELERSQRDHTHLERTAERLNIMSDKRKNRKSLTECRLTAKRVENRRNNCDSRLLRCKQKQN